MEQDQEAYHYNVESQIAVWKARAEKVEAERAATCLWQEDNDGVCLRLENHRLRNLLLELVRSIDRTNYWANIVRAELDKNENL